MDPARSDEALASGPHWIFFVCSFAVAMPVMRESEAFIWRDWTRRVKVRVSELFLPCKMGVPLDARAKQLIAI